MLGDAVQKPERRRGQLKNVGVVGLYSGCRIEIHSTFILRPVQSYQLLEKDNLHHQVSRRNFK
jgi:hypothetical protein